MSSGHTQYENSSSPPRSISPQKRIDGDVNLVSQTHLVNGNHDVTVPVDREKHEYEYTRPASKANMDHDFSEQSSESHSPLSHELNSGNYRFEGSSNDDQYLSNQFFIDDTNKNDHNNQSDNNINLFDLSPDQQLAIRELELRRQQSEFEDDYDYSLNYDQILDYDVREKLESLNAQLANEPSPPEPEHRNSRVAFKDELVSISAPPPEEYELSESEQEEPSQVAVVSDISPFDLTNETNCSPSINSSEDVSTPQPVNETTDVESSLEDSSHQEIHNGPNYDEYLEQPLTKDKSIDQESKSENNIVVSRGGEFQLMDQNDMIDASENVNRPNNDDTFYDDDDKNKPRPISAPATKRNRNEVWSNSQLDSSSSSVKSELNYRSKQNERKNSKMDVPRVDRDRLQRQKEREENKKKEQREQEELESKNRREMNEKCFNAWLQIKNKSLKEEQDRKRKEEEEEKKQKEKLQEERKTQAQEKEKELIKNWEQYKRKEEKLRQYRIKEMEESLVVHTKVECKKAYKEWMKKKRESHQMKQKEEKQKARITRLAMRQCRKSQNLAQAIHQANSFRYLDFYGYP